MTATATLEQPRTTDDLAATLERDGIVVLPNLFTPERLADMQRAFAARLKHLRFTDGDGYEKTEPYRHMIQDVLTLAPGFQEVALDPMVLHLCREYIGAEFALTEAKGWLSLPTRRDFHGWHGDSWYDQSKVSYIPRELKLAFYLTDVNSGAFAYVRGSQQRQAPRSYKGPEVENLDPARILHLPGPAGTAFLFDTSGIHRQTYPILEPRQACFYCYHDPGVPVQQEDIEYNRYHPMLLNAAFLGGLSEEDMRVLGFGDRRGYVAAFNRPPRHRVFTGTVTALYNLLLRWDKFSERVGRRLKRVFGR